MSSIKAITRISLSLGLLTACVVWSAIGLHLIPNPFSQQVKQRVKLCESIAISAQQFAADENELALERYLNEILDKNSTIKSIGVRHDDGRLRVSVGGHDQHWKASDSDPSDADQMLGPITKNGRNWGNLEIKFDGMDSGGIIGFLKFPFPLIVFCSCAVILANWFYLTRVLNSLNPAEVVPDRVRSALDSLAEGLLLTDRNDQILLANEAFSKIVGITAVELKGLSPSDFDWHKERADDLFPWTKTREENNCSRGNVLALRSPDSEQRMFIVNSTPISSENGTCRGVLTSFDDVTEMEKKKDELANMLSVLQKSRDEIRRQNEELQILASRDPLTGCLNRRSFFEKFAQVWEQEIGRELSVMMVDIDHFKSINDNYGHATGDNVLRHVGSLLRNTVDELANAGMVCRYGGEEFCVLMPDMGPDHATAIAETIREVISENPISSITVTTSIGVSSRSFGAMDQQHALDQADQCLYVAKRAGRNQVIRWDRCQDQIKNISSDRDFSGQESSLDFANRVGQNDEKSIQYPAVTALLSALAFRDRHTAMHCSRVSQLCVAIANDLMTPQELYALEIAALLHDIGKIGVPDNILFKPGPLTDDEWCVMNGFHEIGVEIARSAFADEKVAEIIGNYHSVYRNDTDGTDIDSASVLLASKILVLCDSFDAMTSDKVYAKGMSPAEALSEICKQMPDKYDEALVERLRSYVERYPDWHDFNEVSHISKRTAVVLGGHIAQFSEAIAESDISALRTVVKDLQETARKAHVDPVVDATARLQVALQTNETELTQVMELTSEVMDLCRSTRSVIMNTENDQKQ